MAGPDAYGPPAASPDVAPSSAPVVPGRLLGARYELVRPIARGGMAEVWEGQDATLRRAVAIKVLQTHLAGDITFVERFRREAVSAARVAHPCVVATYDAGVDAGTAFIVMELVRGQTLRQLLTASAPLAPGLAVAIALQIADALADAHRAGLVHRDIKPANILLCDDGAGALRVKVTDFGIAKVGAEIGADLTQIGTVLGTPKYLSPEQLEGRVEPDARSDLYALGVVLFEMLTGRPPFNGLTAMATALAHLREPPPPVSSLRPEISPGWTISPTAPGQGARRPAPDGGGRAPDAGLPRPAGPGGESRGRAGPRPGPGRRRGSGAGGASSDGLRPTALSGPVGNEAGGGGRGPRPPGTGPARGRGGAGDGGHRYRRHRDRPPPAVGPPPDPFASRPLRGRRRAEPRAGGAGPARSATDPPPRPGPRIGGGRHRPRRGDRGRHPDRRPRWGPSCGRLGPGQHRGGTTAPSSAASALRAQAVTVWMNTTAHTPDNPGQTGAVIDGQASTMWQTDTYSGPHAAVFGGLYSGEGLAIHLTGTQALHRLVVHSPTQGWAASTYVAGSQPAVGSPVSAWGTPTATRPTSMVTPPSPSAAARGLGFCSGSPTSAPQPAPAIAEVTVS